MIEDVIRPARSDDLAGVLALYRHLHPEEPPLGWCTAGWGCPAQREDLPGVWRTLDHVTVGGSGHLAMQRVFGLRF